VSCADACILVLLLLFELAYLPLAMTPAAWSNALDLTYAFRFAAGLRRSWVLMPCTLAQTGSSLATELHVAPARGYDGANGRVAAGLRYWNKTALPLSLNSTSCLRAHTHTHTLGGERAPSLSLLFFY